MAPIEPSVLVVEDDADTLQMIQYLLDQKGYRVLTAANGQTALDAVRQRSPDVVLLDVMLPDIDGFEVCQKTREFSEVPIVMVTAKVEEEDKVKGLEIGADDYVTKPFSASELAARIKAALRRPTLRKDISSSLFRCEDLAVDFARRRVTLSGKQVPLTTLEYRIVAHLARNAGRVVSADELLETAWDKDQIENYHLLQVNVARLRLKLGEKKGSRKYILTEHGTGYMMIKEP